MLRNHVFRSTLIDFKSVVQKPAVILHNLAQNDPTCDNLGNVFFMECDTGQPTCTNLMPLHFTSYGYVQLKTTNANTAASNQHKFDSLPCAQLVISTAVQWQ